MAVFRIEKIRDFTVVSNNIFKDRTLSAKAKGILVEMLSLPEDWDYTLDGLSRLFSDGIDSIRKGIHELEEHGYIVRRRVRDENGQFSHNEYIIYETPQTTGKPVKEPEEKPQPSRKKSVQKVEETPDSDVPLFASPASDSPSLEKPTMDSPALEKPTTNKERKPSNTNESITKTSNPNPSWEPSPERQPETDAIPTDRMGYEEAKAAVKENIEYDILCERCPKERIDEIVEIAAEALCSGKKHFKIGDDIYPYELVKNRLLAMDSGSVAYLMECMNSNTTKIRKIKQYILQSLINTSATEEHYYAAQVNHDMYGSKEKW